MSALIILTAYLLLGGFTAWRTHAERREEPRSARLLSAAMALLLWPFVLPFLGGDTAAHDEPDGSVQREIECRDRRLSQALGRAQLAAPGLDAARIARFTARFTRRLQRLDGRLAELDRAAAEAPESVREALDGLRGQCRGELDEGLALLDELAGKLTLVAFSDLGDGELPDGELGELRVLLRRLEELACATREVGGLAAEEA
jgi:hypothetical protein